VDLQVVRYEVDRGVALVTLDRPDRLNAWTARMAEEYRWALTTADDDPAVRVVVVTGAGRGFCAGADFQALDGLAETGEYPNPDGPVGAEGPDGGDSVFEAAVDHAHTFPLGLGVPVIAAVNGPVAGVGFVLMCFCDLRFAAAGAKITTSFARLGLPAEHGVSWVLPRMIGAARSADLLFSSRVVLDGGRIVERGTHDDLLDGGGLYEELYQTQYLRVGRVSPSAQPEALQPEAG